MAKVDQIKILNNKIKPNNAQYDINRLNAEISAFSEGDLNKYEFLTRKDLRYKPNALDKAKFEFSPLGKGFNQELDKKAENYKEEGVIKLLKDIRDRMVRAIGGNNDNRNNGGNNGGDDDGDDDGDHDGDDDEDDGYDYNNDNNDNNRDDRIDRDNEEADYLTKRFTISKNRKRVQERINALRKELNNNKNGDDGSDENDEIAEMDSIDLSWMNDLQLYRQIASEVFARYDRDKDSLELFTLQTFIDNVNNEHVKNKKDAREEFKAVKKNVKSQALKEIVKDLEQAIFGDDDNNGNNRDIKEADSLT